MNPKKFRSILIFIWIPIFFISSVVFAQEKKSLTYEQVFESGQPRLTKPLPRIRGWLDDNHFLQQKQDQSENNRELFKISAATGDETIFLDPEDFKDVLPGGFTLFSTAGTTSDYSGFLYNRNNDLYYLNTNTKVFKQLTATSAEEKNPTFSPDGKFIAYTRNRDLFAFDIETGLEHQLTDDASDHIYNGWASWVYYEEILGRRSRYRAFYFSPDGNKLAFLKFDDSPVPKFTLFRANGAHGELEVAYYPKPGDSNPKVKLGIVDISSGETTWADFDENADEYIAWVSWTPDNENVTIQWMNRDQNHIKIYLVDPLSGSKKEIYDEKQDAWVEFFEDLHFFEDGSGFLVRSDVDGWRHLYVYNMDGSLKKRLTKGEWTVRSIQLVDEDNGQIFFTANKDESTESHLYRVGLDGKGLKKLSSIPGSHRIQMSPGGSFYIDTYSNITTPTKMALHKDNGEFVRELGDSKTPEMDKYALGKIELFRVKIKDGFNLPLKWYLPPDFNPNIKYPVLFSVYGGPNAGSVRNSGPSLSSHYRAQQGIIVLNVDHRGSGHFGKKGVAQMYRNLGKWEMHDWIEIVKWLRKKSFVDPHRIGITGGSYGGYATLLALTTGAEYFTHGVSNSPVTDWKLYDTVYTERYMDRPVDNPEGYKNSSAMTNIENFKGKLLLTHGTIDDNVHMQNSIQFIEAMMKHGKQFELMIYPNERHGFRNPERRSHRSKLIDNFWSRHFGNNEAKDTVAISGN
ncbi:DPP IV N-terminal domain-containing protein [candidate division KSB1 bacterium]|nr:DPP IV N-terminal domain-containing protein [candidate division KSB1 bacterium]